MELILGPGKGMHSRTSQEMLNRYYYFNSADCFNIHFMDNGLFGMKTTGPYSAGKDIVRTMCEKLKEMTHQITDEELSRNKNIFKSHIFQVPFLYSGSRKKIMQVGGIHQKYQNAWRCLYSTI
jgi:predicted Zn-dependent peptidase